MRATVVSLVVVGAALAACGSSHDQVAAQMERARVAYVRVEAGPATIVVPEELERAKDSLDAAERAFREHPDDPRTSDMAYLAAGESELVESHVGLILARRRKVEALRELAEEAQR